MDETKRKRILSGLEFLVPAVGLLASAGIRQEQLLQPSKSALAELSGWLFALIAVACLRGLDARLERTLSRLSNRGLLNMSKEDESKFREKLAERGRRYSRFGSWLTSGSVATAYLVVYTPKVWQHGDLTRIELLLMVSLEVAVLFILGRYVGKMISYGSLGRFMQREKVDLRVEPGHPDETAGLKPIGDFFFYQAGMLFIPALFLAFWSLSMRSWIPANSPFVMDWKVPYLILFFLVMGAEWLAFMIPMLHFHRVMQQQKQEHQARSDKMSREIIATKQQLTEARDPDKIKLLEKGLARMSDRFRTVEAMPTWPVAASTRRRFTLSNVVAFAPVVAGFVKETIWG